MSYNLVEAGKAVGLGKTAILKAIRSGRISANRDERGGWSIQPAELHRVYSPVAETTAEGTSENRGNRDGELAELRARLADAQESLADLRRRLDREGEERRQLMALLTDQRQPWWRRLR